MQVRSIDSAIAAARRSDRTEPSSAAARNATRPVSTDGAPSPASTTATTSPRRSRLEQTALDRIVGASLDYSSSGQSALGQVARSIALQGEVLGVYREQIRVGFSFGDKVEFVSRAPDGSISLARLVGVSEADATYSYSVARNGEIPGSLGRIMQADNNSHPSARD